MSSTNRGHGVEIRHPDDFYATPSWCVQALKRVLAPQFKEIRSVLDPCCGTGTILDNFPAPYITYGIEINTARVAEAIARGYSDSRRIGHYDALDTQIVWPRASAIITNPPFFSALQFVEKALLTNTYLIAFLLRLNWLGSKKRRDFHLRNPAALYVMTQRPSFTPDGKTDSIEYAWFVWGKDVTPGTWQLI